MISGGDLLGSRIRGLKDEVLLNIKNVSIKLSHNLGLFEQLYASDITY